MAVVAADRPAVTSRLAAAVKDAAGTALLALALAVPILALRIDQDINNQPFLRPRWDYVAVAVGIAFAARLGYLLIGPWATGAGLATVALVWQNVNGQTLLGTYWDYGAIAAGAACTAWLAHLWLRPQPAGEAA